MGTMQRLIIRLAAALPAVYPRVGWGNQMHGIRHQPPGGLSPRGRGKPNGINGVDAIYGSIPAWAGETITWSRAVNRGTVYPRVGGGNSSAAIIPA